MTGDENTTMNTEQTLQTPAANPATIAVVWSEERIADCENLLRHLDASGGPWAVFAPRELGNPVYTSLPVCHTRGAAQRWLTSGHGLVWLCGASATQEVELIRLAGVTGASLLPTYVPEARAEDVRLGTPITSEALARIEGERRQLQLLRWRGQALRYRQPPTHSGESERAHEKVAPAASPAALADEIASLPEGCRLLSSPDFEVYAARADLIPGMLREIARQREITFRAAGEGTGRALDLDDFDHDYFHLFTYSKKQRELVGAYRLGLVDELVRTRGLEGLYSSTLFKYSRDVFDKLGPTIELGRSFVCPGYQRTSRALLWLWKGIASFVAARPQYRTLIGPVSVSAEYVGFSRDLMVRVLSGATHRHPLHKSVRPRNPVRARSFGAGGLGDPRAVLTAPQELSAVVSDAELDGKGLPVMVREYLKLGGRFLGFNLDHEFSNVIDGLVVVDLLETDRRLLSFYMGRAIDAFVAHHDPSIRQSA